MANKKQPTVDQTLDIDAETLQKDCAEVDERNLELTVIDAKFGDNLPYDTNRLINETRFYLQQSAESMLQAGSRLILLKEHEAHGDFTKALDSIGVPAPTARKMMQAALKFSKRSTSSVLGKSKIFELMSEDDEDLDALDNGGTIAGLTLDDVDRMTVMDLRKTLRKARETTTLNSETHDRLLADKDKKINELDAKLHRRENATDNERANELVDALTQEVQGTINSLLDVELVIKEIAEWAKAPQDLKNLCLQSASRIYTALDEIRAAHALNDIAHEPEDDSWMDEAIASGAAEVVN